MFGASGLPGGLSAEIALVKANGVEAISDIKQVTSDRLQQPTREHISILSLPVATATLKSIAGGRAVHEPDSLEPLVDCARRSGKGPLSFVAKQQSWRWLALRQGGRQQADLRACCNLIATFRVANPCKGGSRSQTITISTS